MSSLVRFSFCAFLLTAVAIPPAADAMDRRRDQFQTQTGYYVFPAPYSLPGIGDGWAVVGVVPNVAETHTDIFGYVLGGDLEGIGLTVSDVHLMEKRLIFDITGSTFNKVSLQAYNSRGMSGDEDDFILMEMDDNDFLGGRMTATFYDRMLEFYAMGYTGGWHMSAIRDNEGELIQTTLSADIENYRAYAIGSRIDYTDDYQNPRTGVRFDLTASRNAQRERYAPDQYALEYSLTGCIPFRKWDTLAINYYQADARVREEGETDPLAVEQIMGLDCSLGTPEQQLDCQSLVNNTVTGNRYGTAGGLGGTSRLRAYPMGRFTGAHTQFLGVEYRWNLTHESTPFDIFIARDIRSAIQLAFFYEAGSVADRRSDLRDETRDNIGVGGRLVTESGLVIRADVAYGDEGLGISVIAGYPWESF